MDRTIYSQTISEVRENDTLFDSRYTHLTEQELHSNWFSEQRTYSKAVLSTWGLNLGEMSYSRDNQQILRCILQLITYRQKDLQFRSKVKDDIASLSFERDKYRSFMQQAQRSLQEVTRRLGKSQNECAQMKNRQKKGQVTSKKQKEEDKKMIAMLRAKNQQIMHQIKKKEAEVLRIKEQMKKSVGEKTMSAKNSFEVFENFSPNKKQNNKQQETKYTFLMERNEKEMTQIVRENTILRQKLFEIRQQLLNFNEWIDKQLFGETDNDHFKRNTRFPFNHNLLFKKESLRDQLADLLETAKDGIRQLRELCKGDVNFSQKKSLSSRVLPNKEDIEELNFKKKLKKIDSIKSDRPKQTQTEEIRQYRQTNSKKPSFGKALGEASENVTPKSSMKNVVQELQSYKTSTPKKLGKIDSNIVKKGRINLQSNKPPFQDQLLSDVGDGQESSIVSHIQVQKLGKNRFEKWDILYNDDE